jgi:hypothetical protein
MMSGEAGLCQKKPQSSQIVEFNVRSIRQVSLGSLGQVRVCAYIRARGTTKVTVGQPGSKKFGSPFQRQFVIFSTRADSIFAEHTAPPIKGKAVYTITE